MKKRICILLTAAMICMFTACGGAKGSSSKPAETSVSETAAVTEMPAEDATGGWTRSGYYETESGYMMSVSWMDEDVVGGPGWYAAVCIGEDFVEDSYGGFLSVEGDALHGTLSVDGSDKQITVTVKEEGEDGLALMVDGGEAYHFRILDMSEYIETGDEYESDMEDAGVEIEESEDIPESDAE